VGGVAAPGGMAFSCRDGALWRRAAGLLARRVIHTRGTYETSVWRQRPALSLARNRAEQTRVAAACACALRTALYYCCSSRASHWQSSVEGGPACLSAMSVSPLRRENINGNIQ